MASSSPTTVAIEYVIKTLIETNINVSVAMIMFISSIYTDKICWYKYFCSRKVTAIS